MTSGAAPADPPRQSDLPDLTALLRSVRDRIGVLPLQGLPGGADLRSERDAVLQLLDGYLVGRLGENDRPLLVVIGGPTGAGKSTLLNSLVGRTVTTVGVLRPTTRTPVLLHHPRDAEAAERLLPGMSGGVELRLVSNFDVPPGMFVLDSPDLDSWLESNRAIAVRMIEIADVWLFVSTGTDYADGLPWDLLRTATRRRAAVATVLNRLRPSEVEVVPRHFARMLVDHGMGESPLIQIPDVPLIDDRIPFRYVQPLQDWLAGQSGWAHRDTYLDRAAGITVDRVAAALDRLVTVATTRADSARRLREDLRALFSLARRRIHERLDAARPPSELAGHWEALQHASSSRRSRWRGGGTDTALGGPENGIVAGIGGLVRSAVLDPVAGALDSFAERAGGDGALPPDLDQQVDDLVAGWLDGIQARVGPDGTDEGRWQPETLAVATSALVGDVAPAHLLPPGVPVDRARADLAERLDTLMDAEELRAAARLGGGGELPPQVAQLRVDLAELERFRTD